MSFRRPRASRSGTLLGSLLLTTAFVVPALAQIETVTVTAEKRVEDIQTVPISVTAYNSADIAAHQINEFKDLQFSTPNVTYTKGNFTGSNFQIRGIGITAVGYDAESGVAVNVDDVFLVNPPLAEANFYDLERIEVLRGPQSTLYGRGATGGVLNVHSAKPDLDAFGADAEGSYGNYNASELKGMVNIPLISDVAAIRLAGDWVRHDGYVTNIADNSHINSEDTYSLRGSLRFKPSEDTTIDIVGSYSHEADSKMRSPKQLCSTDPTGVLGCLPDSVSTGVVNLNSTLATIASSRQGLGGFGAAVGQSLVNAGAIPSGALPGFIAAYQNMGLFDLSVAPTLPAPLDVLNPTDLRKVNTDFAPIYHAHDEFLALNVKQRVADWLDATFVGGYDYHATFSQESYNNVGGQPFNPTTLATAEATFLGVMQQLTGSPAYGNNYLPYFAVPGALPVSGIGGLGLTSGNIQKFSNVVTASDQSDGYSQQYSAELRFNTDFQGPFNFMLAGYYLRATGRGDYYVVANTFDYPFMVVGATLGAITPGLAPPNGACANGCISPGYYHNDGTFNTLTSKAMFGEAYYDIIPDTLKLTIGARFTDDHKEQTGRIFIFPGPVPIGTPSEIAAAQFLQAIGEGDFDAGTPGTQSYQVNQVTYDKWTGRAVLNWIPKLDFTDQTTVYASYARGYKAGGFNPGIQPGLGIQPSYQPESIDAYEVGTKNTLLDGTLQANLTGWYYNYDSLQVSAIVANTSVNQNISAKLWGVEGELLYQPVPALTFNFNFGQMHSSIGNSRLIDQRNPSGGRTDVVLVKDDTLGASVSQNCVIYMTAAAGGVTPADNAAFLTAAAANGAGGIFFAPPGGSGALAGNGVPHVNYGTCNPALAPLLGAFGYSLTDPTGANNASDGVAVNLSGNELQNSPPWSLSAGVQYRFSMDNGFTVTPRVEVHWQAQMWGRIFNAPSDRISSQENTNALITLSSPNDQWYLQGYIKNVFNEDNIVGEYLTSASSGLYTNAFLNDPRLFGIKLGAHF
jgi:outer membrane receptor protein involved in Fe transport